MKELRNGLLAFCFLITLVQGVEVSAESDEQQRVIITFKEEVNETLIEEAEGEINREFESIPVASVTISQSGLNELENSSKIQKIERDVLVRTNGQVQDWGIQSINAPLAWETGYTGKGVKIAVIDSGISPHEDLVIAGGQSFVDYTTSYYDDHGHGTHVAGIIAAKDNGIGVKGVASEAELYAVKVMNKEGESYLSNLIAGVDWAISNDMDIINMSLGAQVDSTAFHNIIDEAYSKGMLIVAAAGNDGTGSGDTVDYPARYSSVIGVGAIDQQNNHASFSSTGPSVEVVAPGVSVLSTYMNGTYARMNGTSMAAPYVAGYFALLKQAYPSLTNVQLRSILTQNTKDLGAPGADIYFGNGLLQGTSLTQPLFSLPASANPAIELSLNVTSLKNIPGQTTQLTALVKLKDGTKLDVTNEAKWMSLNNSIASVSNGEVVSNKIGHTTISANYGGLTTTASVDISNSTTSTSLKDFTDVRSNYWAYNEIKELQEKQIISGYQDNTFKPNATVRRDHVAVLFSRSIPLEKKYEAIQFQDVPNNYIFYEEIKNTQQAGIFSGSGRNFGPRKDLTRAEMAKILVIALNLQGSGEHHFKDINKNHWADEYIRILYVNGITLGSNGQYMPDDSVTRAQYAVFLSRAFALNAK
ncbi:MAG: S8 family serine peptidase [Paenisporosarcina sp.]